MIFRKLIAALSTGETLNVAFSKFIDMLAHGHWMFDTACAVLADPSQAESVSEALYERDRTVNRLERSIRRRILRHLVLDRGEDVPACLALMSVTKDAERIGDYCKNVFEVGRFYRSGFNVPAYHTPLEVIRQRTSDLFGKVSGAFRDSNVERARAAIAEAASIRHECDELIERLLRDEATMQVHEAVAYSLLARHYKRVAAHLSNIATAVLGKVDELDFEPD